MARSAKSASVRKTVTAPVSNKPVVAKDIMAVLEQLPVSDLRAIADKAQTLVKEKGEGERRAFIEEVKAKAASLGISLRDLVGVGSSSRPVAKKAGAKRASPAPKYRGPSGEEWSGRGRAPRWMQALIAEGKKKEGFLIDKG